MKIERIYIGGWFQRTTLQLSEVYDFLRYGSSKLKLDSKKLMKFHDALGLEKVEYDVDGLEYLRFSTHAGIEVKIFEDGLIVLNYANNREYSLFNDLD